MKANRKESFIAINRLKELLGNEAIDKDSNLQFSAFVSLGYGKV